MSQETLDFLKVSCKKKIFVKHPAKMNELLIGEEDEIVSNCIKEQNRFRRKKMLPRGKKIELKKNSKFVF